MAREATTDADVADSSEVADEIRESGQVHHVNDYGGEIEIVYDGRHSCQIFRRMAWENGWVVDSVSVSGMEDGYAAVCLIPITERL